MSQRQQLWMRRETQTREAGLYSRWWELIPLIDEALTDQLPFEVRNLIIGQAQALERARLRWNRLRPYHYRSGDALIDTDDWNRYWLMGRRRYYLAIREVRMTHTEETILNRSYYAVEALLPRAVLGLIAPILRLVNGDWQYNPTRHEWRRPAEYPY